MKTVLCLVASVNQTCVRMLEGDYRLRITFMKVLIHHTFSRGRSIARAQEYEQFTLAGYGNEQQSLSYLPGAIHSAFEGDVQKMGPFILGTSRSSGGDSGGGIWGSRGLIGMNVACTTMPLKFHHLAISEAAIFSPKNIITPALRFKQAYLEELEKECKKEKLTSPPQKKPHYMVEFEGIEVGYGSSD